MVILLDMTVIYKQLIKIYVNIFRSQATTPLLPCVILKDGIQFGLNFKGKHLQSDPKQGVFQHKLREKNSKNKLRKFKINTNEETVVPENPKNKVSSLEETCFNFKEGLFKSLWDLK